MTLQRLRRSEKKLSGLVLASIIFFYGPGAFLTEGSAADGVPKDLINCDIQQGPCTRPLAERVVTLDVLPKPVMAMRDLTFRVSVTGRKLTSNPHIDLGMPGMNMGPNRVDLKPVGGDAYEGRGVIVRCPSGRRTWKATVTLPDEGSLEFVFDVIY